MTPIITKCEHLMKSKVSHVAIIICLFIFKIMIFDFLRNRDTSAHAKGHFASVEGHNTKYIR